jgi:hypothetical protein
MLSKAKHGIKLNNLQKNHEQITRGFLLRFGFTATDDITTYFQPALWISNGSLVRGQGFGVIFCLPGAPSQA